LALAFHGLAYLIDGRQLEERKTQLYLEDERRRSAQRPWSCRVAVAGTRCTGGGIGMSSNVINDLPLGKTARITGGLYLAFVLASFVADRVAHIGLGEAEQLYGAITTDLGQFRFGLVVALISAFLFLMAAWGLYVLLRPVNQHLALECVTCLCVQEESSSSAGRPCQTMTLGVVT
jgi:hypothetical protein